MAIGYGFLAPEHVFVVPPIDQGVDFSVLIVAEQNSPLYSPAEKQVGRFRQ